MNDLPRCGAPTLWDTACTRKVQNKGDRCWRHREQGASSALSQSLQKLRRELLLDIDAIDTVLRLLKRPVAQRIKDAGITAHDVLDELGGQATSAKRSTLSGSSGPGNTSDVLEGGPTKRPEAHSPGPLSGQ